MKRIKHSSLGDYITTLCFYGLTILSFVKANDFLDQQDNLRASILYSLSFVFLLAALRFMIAKIYYHIFNSVTDKS